MTAGAAVGDIGIQHGAELVEFAEAMLGQDEARLKAARAAVVRAMGDAALVDAAGIAGFFNAIDRVADSTGTPLDEQTALETVELRQALGIDSFAVTKRAVS